MSWQTVGSFRNDPKSVKGKKLDKVKISRIWHFARFYKKSIYV